MQVYLLHTAKPDCFSGSTYVWPEHVKGVALKSDVNEDNLPDGLDIRAHDLIGTAEKQRMQEAFREVSQLSAEARKKIGLTKKDLDALRCAGEPNLKPGGFVYLDYVRYDSLTLDKIWSYPPPQREGHVIKKIKIVENISTLVKKFLDEEKAEKERSVEHEIGNIDPDVKELLRGKFGLKFK